LAADQPPMIDDKEKVAKL